MGKAFGLVMLIGVLGAGLYLYTKQAQSVTSVGGSTPTSTIDVTAARNDLLALANAERQYFASNGKYVTLDELASNGGVNVPRRKDYSYSAEVADATFKIVATYSGTDPKAPKRIVIDETMSITGN
jgi:hypothetical protein